MTIELNIVGLNKPDKAIYTNSVSLRNSLNSLVCEASTLARYGSFDITSVNVFRVFRFYLCGVHIA